MKAKGTGSKSMIVVLSPPEGAIRNGCHTVSGDLEMVLGFASDNFQIPRHSVKTILSNQGFLKTTLKYFKQIMSQYELVIVKCICRKGSTLFLTKLIVIHQLQSFCETSSYPFSK